MNPSRQRRSQLDDSESPSYDEADDRNRPSVDSRDDAWPVRRGAASRYVAAVNGGARVRSSRSGRMAKKRGMA
jgi:hypothetical protein